MIVLALGFAYCGQEPITPTVPQVRVVPDSAEQRVDVWMDDELFTAYVYADTLSVLEKPVLDPLRAPSGAVVTRGFPLNPAPGDRVDHPHHVGLWFNHGEVNGLDFWNNSDAISPERAASMGTIRHRAVTHVESGAGRGVLDVTMDWLAPDGQALLREDTRFAFHAEPERRVVERITTLTSPHEAVSFEDNKEGALGLRVARALEMPVSGPVDVMDEAGGVTQVPGEEVATGSYRNSEGVEGYPNVWGKRARWMTLTGVVHGDSVTVAILDHPQNVGFPTHWHARDYGLFAANPFGQAAFDEEAEAFHFTLAPGQSTTLKHRVVLYSGHVSPEVVETYYQDFAIE